VRHHPVASFALGNCDFVPRHLVGNLPTHLDCIGAPLQGGEIEPLVRGHQVDSAGAPARPVKPALEQHVWNRGCVHRHCAVEIENPLKHLSSPFCFSWPSLAGTRPLPPRDQQMVVSDRDDAILTDQI